jgi:two-component system, OmpR family, phosphate regulon response regulator PhoB
MLARDSRKQILIIDTDAAAVEPLRQKLCEVGFGVRAITDGSAADAAMGERLPHLVIIDWNMPGFAALDLIADIRGMRAPHAVRLMLLSALSSEPDVVAGFDIGADEYVTKPFSVREVVARVFALLRARAHENGSWIIGCDDLMIDASTNRVTVHGRPLKLSGVEYRLLQFLMAHPGRTFHRAQLLAEVWGSESDVDERTIDVNVQRLRKILEEPGYGAHIQTVRGFGYRFVGSESHS